MTDPRTIRSLGVEAPGKPISSAMRRARPHRTGPARRALQRLFGRHRADLPEGHQSLSAFPLGRERGVFVEGEPASAIPCRSSATWRSRVSAKAARTGFKPRRRRCRPMATRPATPQTPSTNCWSGCRPTSTRSSASSSPRWGRSPPTASCMPTPRCSARNVRLSRRGIAGRPVIVFGAAPSAC